MYHNSVVRAEVSLNRNCYSRLISFSSQLSAKSSHDPHFSVTSRPFFHHLRGDTSFEGPHHPPVTQFCTFLAFSPLYTSVLMLELTGIRSHRHCKTGFHAS